jgi:hypothetical protein
MRLADDQDPPWCYLPSPQEIEIECAKIRAGWSWEEREKRQIGVQNRSRAAVDPAIRREAEVLLAAELQRRQRQVG